MFVFSVGVLLDGLVSEARIGHVNGGFASHVFAVAPVWQTECVVVGGDDGSLQVVWMRTEQIVLDSKGHEVRVTSVVVSKGGNRIFSGSVDCTLRTWDMRTGTCIAEPLGSHGGPVTSAVISEDMQ